MLSLAFTVIAAESDNADSLISFGTSSQQSEASLRDSWMKTPVEVRRKLSHFLLDMGLSSTGAIRLIGVYIGPRKNQQMFHFQQLDLFGSRLFWSILVSPDTMQARVLYHVDEKKIKGDWIAIE
ncbi:MAG TPA: hypothetical protein VIW07_13345 [Candidatus Udaeobacter sp.]|jgi:hypothetical protein